VTDSPLVVDSHKLPRQPGASLEVAVPVTIGDDLAGEVMRAEPGETTVNVLLESVMDGILATGSATIPVTGECVRCVTPLRVELPIEFRQFHTYRGVEQPDDEDSDTVPITDPELDLTGAFHDAVVLALPLTPTCRSDCPGLCPECGAVLADDPDHRHERTDPRWAELARWRDSDPSPEGD